MARLGESPSFLPRCWSGFRRVTCSANYRKRANISGSSGWAGAAWPFPGAAPRSPSGRPGSVGLGRHWPGSNGIRHPDSGAVPARRGAGRRRHRGSNRDSGLDASGNCGLAGTQSHRLPGAVPDWHLRIRRSGAPICRTANLDSCSSETAGANRKPRPVGYLRVPPAARLPLHRLF